jgi:rod shape-determining protein MreD
MRVLAYGLMGLVAVVVQMAVLPVLAVRGMVPWLSVALVVAVGLLYGPTEGVWAGGVVGGLTDLAVGRYVGLGTLAHMAVGYVAGRLAWLPPSARAVAAFVGSGAAAMATRAWVTMGMRLGGAHVPLHLALGSPISALYTALAGVVALSVLDGAAWGRRRRGARRRRRAGAYGQAGGA